MCPPGRIALRSLIETLMILAGAPDIFNWSPTVLAVRRQGEEPGRLAEAPTRRVFGSLTLVTMEPVSRSYHSLATIPLAEGGAPVRKVEWPTAVTVAAWG